MIFIINGRVRFNEYEGTLESVSTPHNMQPLAAATCRLLSIFVRNNEMLIKRQQLLEEVWEERGLKGTNSNLNNYISLLRRHLAQLGETELIITYPRQGFKFVANKISRHATTEPEKEKNAKEENIITGQTAPRGRGSGKLLSIWRQLQRWNKWFNLILFISIAALITVSHQYSARNNTFIGTQFAGCKIYSMGWDYPENETVTDMVRAYVNCQKKTKVYYYNKITQDNRQFEEKMLVSCRENAGRQPCEVVYIP
nr:winged helix-turn-helix domain-containing protein [Serratia marcescens]